MYQISLLKKMGFSSSQDAGPGSPAIEPACSILGIDQVRTYSIYGEIYDVFCSEGVRWVG
jgi:hypothetical protein